MSNQANSSTTKPRLLKYPLATVYFAATVGCVVLWWASVSRPPMSDYITLSSDVRTVYFDAYDSDFSVYSASPKVER